MEENCQTKVLELGGIHCRLGPLGYKSLTFALSINKLVLCIEFYNAEEDQCYLGSLCMCCFSYLADMSKGLFLKAFKHNPDSDIFNVTYLCSLVFGPHTWKAWQAVKSNLNCGPYLCSGDTERYHDIQEYVSIYDNDYDVSFDDNDVACGEMQEL